MLGRLGACASAALAEKTFSKKANWKITVSGLIEVMALGGDWSE